MKKITLHKKHKLFFITGLIAIPLLIMDPYNWWLIAIIIITFLIITFMTKGSTQQQKELSNE